MMTTDARKDLSTEATNALLEILKKRFQKNMHRHPGVTWPEVQGRLLKNPGKLWSLQQMEDSGGEPDVILTGADPGIFIFYDCSPESPKGRRSLCYDKESLESRKKFKPENNAVDVAREMGIELLTEEQYRRLQQTGDFDTKTSSWILTPETIRQRGGALFCDFRYGQVFVYHNGAESYYAARGFRGSLNV